MYDYGAKVKIVYFKSRAVFKGKYEKNPIFPELDEIPREFRDLAALTTIYNAPLKGEEAAPLAEAHQEEQRRKPSATTKGEAENGARMRQSISRARSRIFEIAFCNEFTHFCTFTQSAEMRNRFDLEAFIKDFGQFVRNLNRTRKDNPIKYLLIPEPHLNSRKASDRGAWHMHGLLMGLTENDLTEFTKLDKIPRRLKEQLKREKVYNWAAYASKFGYFTCTDVKSQEGCSKYLTKYITKDLALDTLGSGRHLFYASQGLKRRQPIVTFSKDKCPISEWEFENDYVKVRWFDVPKTGQ